MAIQQNFPTISPSITLNFASSRTLDPRITFTRTSSATCFGPNGLLKTVPADAPRFDHNPTTGESLGLLVERQGTNLLLRSEEFGDANWTKSQSSVSSNTTTSPAGTLTADSLVENSASGTQHYASQTVTISANTIYTATVYVKANTRLSVRFGFLNNALSSGAYAHFNVSTGVISEQTTAGTASNVSFGIEAATSGWYRCRTTCTVDSSSTLGSVFIGLVDGTNNATYTGDGTSGLFLWGAQLEQESFSTSYIPTSDSTATRATDNVNIIGSNFSDFYTNDNSGSIVVSAKEYNGRNSSPFWFNDGSGNRGIAYRRLGSDISFNVRSVADSISVTVTNGVPINQINKVAASFSSLILNVCSNGSNVQTGTSLVEITPNINRLTIGFSQIGGTSPFYWYGHIQRLTYWSKILPNEQLQALTK